MPPLNILLIVSHQHRYDCLAQHGHPLLRTPGFGRLLERGVDFTHAYTPSALPSATRASLLTGRWPVQMPSGSAWGLESFRTPTDAMPTVPGILGELGYRCGWVGNFFHETRSQPRDLGFERFINDKHYLAWRQQQKLPTFGTGDWKGGVDKFITEEQSRLAWSVDQIETLIGEFTQGGEQPFFIRWDPMEPALPNFAPYPYGAMYAPRDIEPWPSFADSLEGKPSIQTAHRRVWRTADWTWNEWAPLVAGYLGEIGHLDRQITRLLKLLESRNLAENTVIIYTSDTGTMLGSHGILDGAYLAYDDVIHVPLIVSWPGRLTGGDACPHLAYSTLDISATLLDAAGMEAGAGFAGVSLADIAEGNAGLLREDVYIAWPGGKGGTFHQRVIREFGWKYVWNATTCDELYNLEDDPHELHNLVDDPDQEEHLQHLRERVVEWMDEVGDPLQSTWMLTAMNNGMTVL